MKAYGEVDVQTPVSLTSALIGGDWSASRPDHFTPGNHLIGGWMGPRTGQDDVEKILDTTQDPNSDPSVASRYTGFYKTECQV
jgi:hypothetical protein